MRTDTSLKDPLVDTTDPDRPNYAFGMMLDVRDFVDEQTYHRGRLARALQFVAGTGTVAGMQVTYAKPLPPGSPDAPSGKADELHVGAGLAIDGRGRLIEITTEMCITLTRWWDAQDGDALTAAFTSAGGTGVIADLFVRFVACGRGRTPAFAAGPADALDASVYSRVRDAFELTLVPRTEKSPPVPLDPWDKVTGANPAAKLASLRTAVFQAYKRSTDADRPDHAVVPETIKRELDWVFLARIKLPATAGTNRPTRTVADPDIDNDIRLFVLAPSAVLRLLQP
jgi:hypothetical protein